MNDYTNTPYGDISTLQDGQKNWVRHLENTYGVGSPEVAEFVTNTLVLNARMDAEQHGNGDAHTTAAAKVEKALEPTVELDEAMMEQARACAAVLEEELTRLMRVTPRLQLFCQHPKDELNALSGIFNDVEKAALAAIQVNLAGYNVNYLLNECTTDKPVTN